MPPRALVTGAGGTFGAAIAEGLVRAGFETLCVVRDAGKGEALLARIDAGGAGSGGARGGVARAVVCDLASRESIARCLSAALDGGGARPLDVLVNNAAYVPDAREETAEGVEAQFAVNVLGYARVWCAALPALRRAPAPRAVFVASHYAGDLDLTDVEFKRRRYDPTSAYRASKQANRMLARAFAAAEPGVRVFSCHPGIADSSVARGLGASFEKGDAAARAGAATPLFVATMPLEGTTSGTFWSDRRMWNCPFIRNTVAVEALAKLVESYDGVAQAAATSEAPLPAAGAGGAGGGGGGGVGGGGL